MDSQKLLTDLALQLLSGGVEVVDLSGVLGPETPILQLPPELAVNSPKVEIHKISAYDKDGPFWAWNWLKFGEHSGTHFDAPIHWISGRSFVDGATDTIPVQNFVGPVNVIDCSEEVANDPDFLLTSERIKAWEAEHGAIGKGEWVVMRTDWYKRNGDEAAFLNTDETGPHTPGPSADAIEYLVAKGINGWGSETIGTDAGNAAQMAHPFPAHDMMHKANKYGLASLCNLDKLPPRGAILVVAPLKIKHGTGSPMRALALVPGR